MFVLDFGIVVMYIELNTKNFYLNFFFVEGKPVYD